LAIAPLAVSGLGGGSVVAAPSAPDFRLIVNLQNPVSSASREFVAGAFLKKKTRWRDGTLIRPVDQRFDASVRRRFSQSVLKRSIAAIRNYWQQKIFAGRDVPPPELDSDDAVIRYVAEHPGAIGYISAAASLERVKSVTLE
jgi:ABC-type phosphate transport system substrate-binding protein